MRAGTRLLAFLAVIFAPTVILSVLIALDPALQNPALDALLWPLKLCVWLAGPSPEVGGSPGHRWREGTPIQLVGILVGLCLSYLFWLAVIIAVLKYRAHRAKSGR